MLALSFCVFSYELENTFSPKKTIFQEIPHGNSIYNHFSVKFVLHSVGLLSLTLMHITVAPTQRRVHPTETA